MKTIIEKIESGFYNLDSFSEDDKGFLMSVLRISYNEGLEAGQRSIIDKVTDAIKEAIEESKQ